MTVFPGGPQDSVKYFMTGPDGSVATFNDPLDANYIGMLTLTGMDSPDIREALDVRSGTDGGLQGLNFRGPRAVVLNIEIVPNSTTDRNTKFQKLKRASNALRLDGTLDFTPDGGSPQQRLYFRLNGPIRRQETSWKYTIQVPLMAADPYIYSSALRTSTNAGAGGATATLTNQGDAPSAPSIDVTFTATSVLQLINNTTGQAVSTTAVDPTLIIPYNNKFGTTGTGNGQFSGPQDVAVDASGNIYVVDGAQGRVQKFNSSFVYQSSISIPGNFQTWLCTDASSNLYVSGQFSGTNLVRKYNSAGTLQWTHSGATFGATNGPRGIDVDGTNLHVCDWDNAVIKTFNMGTGVFAASYGAPGTGNGQYNSPNDIAIDTALNRYIADYGNKRIQKLNSSNTYQAQVGSAGTGNGQFLAPYNVMCTPATGDVWVSDTSRQDIQKFNTSLVYQTKLGYYGTANGAFSTPEGMDIAGTKLYVADTGNNRIQLFDISGTGIATFSFGTASVAAGGLNLYKYIDVPNTTWWSLAPGDTSVRVQGSGVTTWTANWRDAWL